MMPTPVVSVIMPAYNAAAYLNEAVASVVSQNFTDWEMWFIPTMVLQTLRLPLSAIGGKKMPA